MLAQELRHTKTTLDIVACYERASLKWDTEIRKVYGWVATEPSNKITSDGDTPQTVADWEKFRDAHLSMVHAILGASEGSMWDIRSAEYRYEFLRDHATRMMGLFEYASADIAD